MVLILKKASDTYRPHTTKQFAEHPRCTRLDEIKQHVRQS